MKRLLFVLFIPFALYTQAQYSEPVGQVKLSGGYTQDFPGLNGYAVSGEFARPISDRMEVGFGAKHINLIGHPRTPSIQEYTKATTIDFNLYFLPLHNDEHKLRIGIGYAFSFYKARRSYPLLQTHEPDQVTTWPVQNHKGKISGVSFIGEYEYIFPESNFSLGIRAGSFKAYDRVTFIGPFVGIKI